MDWLHLCQNYNYKLKQIAFYKFQKMQQCYFNPTILDIRKKNTRFKNRLTQSHVTVPHFCTRTEEKAFSWGAEFPYFPTHNEINRRTMTHPGGGTRYQLRWLVGPKLAPDCPWTSCSAPTIWAFIWHLNDIWKWITLQAPEIALFSEPFSNRSWIFEGFQMPT